MSQLQPQNILIDLDALVDTRIGVMKSKFPRMAQILDVPQYVKRVRNDLWVTLGVPEEDWKAAWDARDVDTLLHSSFTDLYHNIPLLLGGHLASGLISPVLAELKIQINTWPYLDLHEDEKADIIHSVRARLWTDCDVQCTYIPHKDITPEFLKSHFNAYVIYDFEAWMAHQSEALTQKRIPTVTIYYPAVINHYDEDEFHKMIDQQMDPFIDLRKRLAEYITVDGVDASIFSCHYHLPRHP